MRSLRLVMSRSSSCPPPGRAPQSGADGEQQHDAGADRPRRSPVKAPAASRAGGVGELAGAVLLDRQVEAGLSESQLGRRRARGVDDAGQAVGELPDERPEHERARRPPRCRSSSAGSGRIVPRRARMAGGVGLDPRRQRSGLSHEGPGEAPAATAAASATVRRRGRPSPACLRVRRGRVPRRGCARGR